jgi:hypothetical protein
MIGAVSRAMRWRVDRGASARREYHERTVRWVTGEQNRPAPPSASPSGASIEDARASRIREGGEPDGRRGSRFVSGGWESGGVAPRSDLCAGRMARHDRLGTGQRREATLVVRAQGSPRTSNEQRGVTDVRKIFRSSFLRVKGDFLRHRGRRSVSRFSRYLTGGTYR